MNDTHQGKIAVVGIGNLLLTDDGIGIHALRELEARYRFPGHVDLLDGGTMGLDLLPFLEGKDRILFLDAVSFGKAPGTIGELNNGEIPGFFATKLSVHQIALPDLLGAGRLLGTLPERMCLIGIEPESIESGYGLSPTLGEQLEGYLTAVLERLAEWGVHPSAVEYENDERCRSMKAPTT
ncbi:MAG: hydrogenase maturation protease [Deltaproteobacteria bacterium]|nr:hydrogenase maturation protease [Deltaproteobacteria bacterium]